MARDIIAWVAKTGGANLLSDIMTLQQLLNQVPPNFGGPAGPARLPVDGIASPDFWAALERFRTHNPVTIRDANGFGPGSITLAKLNEFDTPRVLSRTSIMLCPHGGAVNVVSTGKTNVADISLAVSAQCIIAACPMPDMNTRCMRVEWIAGATPNFLDARSVGMCLSATGVPTGPVNVVHA